ncbi:MAG: CRISPR-associated helicase Cas3' [Ignavibacteriae bacterium]|nr:MAG: CRISPR-associated helicase Cas3' [Ignavibacteriota bacterium]
MNNFYFSQKDNGIASNHSILSSYLYLLYYFSKISVSKFEPEIKEFIFFLSFLFVHPIEKHHSRLYNPYNLKIDVLIEMNLNHYSSLFTILDSSNLDNFIRVLQNEYQKVLPNKSKNIKNSFILYSIIKLNSSLLTASDYYATNEFMLGLEVNDFGIFDEKLKTKVVENVGRISYNKKLFIEFELYKNLSIANLNKRSNKNLNILRQKLSADVINEITKAKDKNLFYIEAPTGAGKTNLSILSICQFLNLKRNITKVFYVFPFTTLITQTFDTIKKKLKLDNSEIIELHSKAEFYSKDDENYGDSRKNYIDSLFINYPITLMSHINFFDILTSTAKEKVYLLHRLANSIVILDELQSYSPNEWDKINYLIKNFSKYYNIIFVLMSATLPKISKLLINNVQDDEFNYLVKNKKDYYKNANFSKRVKIKEILINNFSKERLIEIVYAESEKYSYNNDGLVKCVIEFVTRKSALNFYDFIKKDNRFSQYKIFLISGTILEARRRDILEYLKNKISSKTIVITTQVIEAGVDIDMDIGFKDKSLIDSEEQIAGRINRNAKKQNSKLFLFYTGDAKKVYQDDIRFQQSLLNNRYIQILKNKEFDTFYKLVFEELNQNNRNELRGDNLAEFLDFVKNSNYKEIDKSFELIKSNSISVFVPLSIPTKYFSMKEIEFLNLFIDFKLEIDGFKVWDIYEKIISNKTDDFILWKVNLKIISSILIKFTFSMWNNPHSLNEISFYGEQKYGYFFLKNYEDIYSFEDGLKNDFKENINFIGF